MGQFILNRAGIFNFIYCAASVTNRRHLPFR